uniref:Protein MCM10 homolog n=1 Tax=Meloidogyne javanica TaxID=6303 RepID=A0A915MA82_MELJA
MFTNTASEECKEDTSKSSQTSEIFDPLFGIRISNPKLTLETSNTFFSGMQKLRLSQLSANRLLSMQKNENEEGWATMAVMVERSGCKKSGNGNEYIIWRMSDLKVLLFGDCFRQYWKLQPGNAFFLNNPQVCEPSANNNNNSNRQNELTLKLFKPGQLIEVGFCPDLGRCQGRKASDGDQCSNFVNISRSLYCPFHIQQRARQVAAKRGTLNRTANLPTKEYRLQSKGRSPQKERPPPELVLIKRRKSLAEEKGKKFIMPMSASRRASLRNSSLNESLTKIDPELEKQNKQIEKLISENPFHLGSKNLRIMRQRLSQPSNKENIDPKANAAKPSESASNRSLSSMRDFIQTQQNSIHHTNSSPITRDKQPILLADSKNVLNSNELNKLKRAAEIFKAGNGGAIETTAEQFCQQKKKKGGSLLGGTFTEEQLNSLLNKKSSYEHEADQEQLNRQNLYFDRREVEEQIETNATSLMEIRGCKVCDYTSVNQSTYCKLSGHQVKRHVADKRFFKCMDCKRRVICYEKMPLKPCLNCKSTKYIRVAMCDERKVLLEQEKLKIKEVERNFSTTSEATQQRPPIILNANKQPYEARQQAKSSNKSTIYLNDRMLELTIGNRFEEPLLNIDEYNLKPSISGDPHEKSVLERNGFIHMPVKQARLLIQRIYKLSEIKFQIDKSLTLLSMDRWTETPLENGLLQQLYTYKIPGMLFGDYQQTFYLSVLQFKALRHSEDSTSINKNSKESMTFEQELTKKPFIYISQHSLKPNIYHLWDQNVFVIEVPVKKIFELACKIDALLSSSNEALKHEKAEEAKEKLVPPKPRFNFNKEDPISYFATPLDTPCVVKEIIHRPSTVDQRLDRPKMEKEWDKTPKMFSQQINRSIPQQNPERSYTRPNQSGNASIFSEKLKEAITIRNDMGGNIRDRYKTLPLRQQNPERNHIRPKQFHNASFFSEKLKEAITIRNAMGGNIRDR